MSYPYATGDVLTAADMNGLVAFAINAQTGTSYTAVLNDQYSKLITMDNAAANDFLMPPENALVVEALAALTCMRLVVSTAFALALLPLPHN